MKRALLAPAAWALVGLAPIPLLASCGGRHFQKEYLRKCECGTPEHDVLGCTGSCAAGEADCGNARCTCERTKTSAGE